MRGICVNNEAADVLQVGAVYYLFEHGPNNYYVARFDNPNAHFGSYEKRRFELIEDEAAATDEPPADHIPVLNREKVYSARLIYRKPGYDFIKLGTYYIEPLQTHARFYHDPQMQRLGGCFPLHWFDDFKEHEPGAPVVEVVEPEPEPEELPPEKWEQTTIFDFLG